MEELKADAEETALSIFWKPTLKYSQCVKNYTVKVIDDKGSSRHDIQTLDDYYEADKLDSCMKFKIIVQATGDAGFSEKRRIEETTKPVSKS